jgi:type II secretory pathway pseudopilin PulG
MTARKSTGGPGVLLPWERRTAWLGRLGSRRRLGGLLLVLAAVGLAALAYRVADRRARVRSTRAAIAEVQRAVSAFRAEVGRCPRSTVELVHPPKAGAKYLNEIPSDGWGRELYVRCPSRLDPSSAEVISPGPSGSLSLDDNIL